VLFNVCAPAERRSGRSIVVVLVLVVVVVILVD
jgi:hypothetical protein